MIINNRLFLYPVNFSKDTNEVQFMKKFFSYVPNEYLELIKGSNGLDLRLDNEYLVEIWNPKRCVEYYEAYLFHKYLPDAIPIGGDGGDLVILYFKPNISNNKIYITELGDLDENSLVLLSNSLTNFLSDGIGFDIFIKF